MISNGLIVHRLQSTLNTRWAETVTHLYLYNYSTPPPLPNVNSVRFTSVDTF